MKYSNSSLVDCTILSPNHSGQRTHNIDRITPHCVVGQLTAEAIGGCFPKGKGASCNYGIGKDGRICLVVEEQNRSWCSSSNDNDQRAVTIEVASDKTTPYAFTDAAYNKLIELCVDICKRNGKKKLLWMSDKNTTLNYNPKSDEMVLTVHRWFANKSCPGDWMFSRMENLAKAVTDKLGGKTNASNNTAFKSSTTVTTINSNVPYKVRVSDTHLSVYTGAGTNFTSKGYISPGVYTIIEEKSGQGAIKWGKLKSGAGYIPLDNTTKV